MKKHFFSLMVSGALILGAITGCNDKPETEPNPDPAGRVAITFEADITPPSILKVANDQWEASDKVGLYMKKAGQALTTAGAVYNDAANVQMSLSGQTLVSDPALFYPLEGNVDFVAYYPYTATVGADYTIPVNVAEQATGLPVEVLYSNNSTNRAPTELAVPLNFRYSLAKLVVTVTGSANSALTAADFAGMTVSVEGMYTQANLQLTDGTFTTHQGLQAINLYKAGSTATFATFDALVLPATVAPSEIIFVFTLNGNSYRCPVNGNYNAATQYGLAFNIDLPAPPERVATLLNAIIIPRTDENRNFTVDTDESAKTITSIEYANEGRMNIEFMEFHADSVWAYKTITWNTGKTETVKVGGRVYFDYTKPEPQSVNVTNYDLTYGENIQTGPDISGNAFMRGMLSIQKYTGAYTCKTNFVDFVYNYYKEEASYKDELNQVYQFPEENFSFSLLSNYVDNLRHRIINTVVGHFGEEISIRGDAVCQLIMD